MECGILDGMSLFSCDFDCRKTGARGATPCTYLGHRYQRSVIRTAELGIYGQRAFDRTSPHLLSGYFKRLDEHRYQVADDVRACCTFRHEFDGKFLSLTAIPRHLLSKCFLLF